ncbi:MAG: tRNA 5-methoxyuridine(34)/uridine 5-oxyacetic acid(34) synthase CmoB [Bdellovibrionota bacterium]
MNYEQIPDPIRACGSVLDIDKILSLRSAALAKVQALASWDDVRRRLEQLPMPQTAISVRELKTKIIIGNESDLTKEQHLSLDKTLRSIIPWRVGPYSLFGHEIDTEWQSNFKWARIEPLLGDLEDKRIADIGCNNGYFMMRLLEKNPHLIVGIDPVIRCMYQFFLLQRYLQSSKLAFEPIGIDQMLHFPKVFHLAICMGVIYHQKDPLKSLRAVYESLLPKGRIILESMAIPGDEPIALCPPDRYTKMRNSYFIPTAECMRAWLQRVGFEEVEIVSIAPSSTEEQRRTEFSPDESLEDFLDPNDLSKTIEGHPAPLRAIVVGSKLKR